MQLITLKLSAQEIVVHAAAVNRRSPPTEIVLARSHYTGPAFQITLNGEHLLRALTLGCERWEFQGSEKPLKASSTKSQKIYLTMPVATGPVTTSHPRACRVSTALMQVMFVTFDARIRNYFKGLKKTRKLGYDKPP